MKNLTDMPNLGAFADIKNGKIYVNPSSWIMTFSGDTLKGFDRFLALNNLTKTDAFAVLLIHELLHITGDRGEDNEEDSGGIYSKSVQISLEVRRNCLPNSIQGMSR